MLDGSQILVPLSLAFYMVSAVAAVLIAANVAQWKRSQKDADLVRDSVLTAKEATRVLDTYIQTRE